MSEKKNDRLLFSLIIVLILAFIAIGYLAYKNYKLNQKLDNFIEYTNNLLAADDVQSGSLVETVHLVKDSKSTFILNSPIRTDYHISKTYGFYKNSSTNELELHEGIDFVVQHSGISVYPVYEGTVIEVGFNNELGNYVTLLHPNGYKSRYCNLNSFRVKKGETASTKRPIATVGNTGISEEPHLGFRLYEKTGNTINPTNYFTELPKPTILPDKE